MSITEICKVKHYLKMPTFISPHPGPECTLLHPIIYRAFIEHLKYLHQISMSASLMYVWFNSGKENIPLGGNLSTVSQKSQFEVCMNLCQVKWTII